jgi:hypothetical protein
MATSFSVPPMVGRYFFTIADIANEIPLPDERSCNSLCRFVAAIFIQADACFAICIIGEALKTLVFFERRTFSKITYDRTPERTPYRKRQGARRRAI